LGTRIAFSLKTVIPAAKSVGEEVVREKSIPAGYARTTGGVLNFQRSASGPARLLRRRRLVGRRGSVRPRLQRHHSVPDPPCGEGRSSALVLARRRRKRNRSLFGLRIGSPPRLSSGGRMEVDSGVNGGRSTETMMRPRGVELVRHGLSGRASVGADAASAVSRARWMTGAVVLLVPGLTAAGE